MLEYMFWVVCGVIIVIFLLWVDNSNYINNPETSKEYREWYCKALNWERIEWTLCVDKENKTLYIFKTDYENNNPY
jgi:hypothetical protein